MKKLLVLLLALALVCSLAGCAAIQKGFAVVRAGLGELTGGASEDIGGKLSEALGGSSSDDQAGGGLPGGLLGGDSSVPPTDNAPQSNGSGGSGGSGSGASGGEKRPELASLEGYWEKLEYEWENAPEEGYVWTITIDQMSTMDVMGLAQVEYDLDLSCSHVGKTAQGVYRGEMAMAYAADLSGLISLVTLTGGSVDYDADGWFKNGNFLMNLGGYDQEEDELFVTSLEIPADNPEEQAMMDAMLGQYLGDLEAGSEDFEESSQPDAMWCDWDFHMTEGDMSGYINMTGIAYGTTSGGGGVDASGKSMSGSASASALGYTFTERYSETLESPFPYTIKVYGNNVVMELFSAQGGPVTVKFYGTIDKVPVENTILP